VDMKVRGLKRSDAVDRTLCRLGCRNRLTLHAWIERFGDLAAETGLPCMRGTNWAPGK